MLKNIAYVFGLLFLAAGVMGFIPATAPGGLLLGLFHVNLWHNLFHVATGVVAIWAGSQGHARTFFQLFGVIYAVLAVLGFYYGDAPILGFIANNMADNLFHTTVALVSLYFGFVDVQHRVKE